MNSRHFSGWMWSEALSVLERAERLHRHFFTHAEAAWEPPVDIVETADQQLVVKADLPEMKREDIKISFENNVLTIEGERKFAGPENREQHHRVERGFGAFRRSFTMPNSVDGTAIVAEYQDGVLTVTVPRRADTRPRQIQIS